MFVESPERGCHGCRIVKGKIYVKDSVYFAGEAPTLIAYLVKSFGWITDSE